MAPSIRLRPPGSDWLFLKLYGPPTLQDELIADELLSFAEFAMSAGFANDWFFIRYQDPEPHLRIRFRGKPDALITRLLPQVCRWAASLVADGCCARFCFDTYEREVERYGGEAGVELAENIFAIDSRAVATLLRLADNLTTIDRAALAVLSVDDLLAGLGAGVCERLDLYRVTALSRADGQDYRQRRAMLRRLLAYGPAGEPGGDVLPRVLVERRRGLEPLAGRLDVIARDGGSRQARTSLLQSYVHMHCNRLLGIEAVSERRVFQLARRTRESLTRTSILDA